MKTISAKKKPAKSLEAALAGIDADIANVVAAIVAERQLKRPAGGSHRRGRRVAAHAA